MSDDQILREVDEELRSDRMRLLWRRFGPYVIGAAVAIVIVVAINEGWSWYQQTTAARSSNLLYDALELAEDGEVAAAQEALNKVEAEGSGAYPLLARFRSAALLAEDGKTEEAIAAYDALANEQTDQRIRELALLLAAFQLVDSGDVAAVEARIGGMLDDTHSLHNGAREALGLTQYKAGELEAALASFERIANDPSASFETLGRMRVYVAQLIAEGASSGDEAGEEASAAETPAEGAGSADTETAN